MNQPVTISKIEFTADEWQAITKRAALNYKTVIIASGFSDGSAQAAIAGMSQANVLRLALSLSPRVRGWKKGVARKEVQS